MNAQIGSMRKAFEATFGDPQLSDTVKGRDAKALPGLMRKAGAPDNLKSLPFSPRPGDGTAPQKVRIRRRWSCSDDMKQCDVEVVVER